MKKTLIIATTAITILFNGIVFGSAGAIYEADVLSGDPRLACEAILCLSKNGTRPSECNESLERYFSIRKKKWWKTKQARKRFLELCPKADEEEVNNAVNKTKEERTAANEAANQAAANETSASASSGGASGPVPHGILWKPVSENDNNLVVLLGTTYGSPDVNILDENGNIIESGRYTGRSNGSRATYRFNRPGGGYPDPCYLQVGEEVVQISNPSQRHE